MATYLIAPICNNQIFDSNGNLLVGGKIFTYLAGTSTKADTFKDSLGVAKHTNPIVLTALGMPPSPVYLLAGQGYKFVLAPAGDSDPPSSPIYTWDNVLEMDLTPLPASQWTQGTTPTYVSANSFSVAGDQTSTYHVGRRLQMISTIGTFYGWITAVAFTSVTTVTVAIDSGSLDATLHTLYYSVLTSIGGAVPDTRYSNLDAFFAGKGDFPDVLDALNLTLSGNILIPVGFGPVPYSGRTAPAGWVLANGQNLANETYPALLDVALDVLVNSGLTYAAGSGSNKVDFATTDVNTSTDEITETAHGLSNGQRLYLTSTGTIPAGLAAYTKYFVVNATTNTFKLSATLGGAAIDITSQGTGTHSFYKAFIAADVRGRVPMGIDNMGGSDAARVTSASTGGANADTPGGSGGAQTHTLSASEMPSHAHNLNTAGAAGSALSHVNVSTTATDISWLSGYIQSTGGDGAHSNTQPWVAYNFIIYAGP